MEPDQPPTPRPVGDNTELTTAGGSTESLPVMKSKQTVTEPMIYQKAVKTLKYKASKSNKRLVAMDSKDCQAIVIAHNILTTSPTLTERSQETLYKSELEKNGIDYATSPKFASIAREHRRDTPVWKVDPQTIGGLRRGVDEYIPTDLYPEKVFEVMNDMIQEDRTKTRIMSELRQRGFFVHGVYLALLLDPNECAKAVAEPVEQDSMGPAPVPGVAVAEPALVAPEENNERMSRADDRSDSRELVSPPALGLTVPARRDDRFLNALEEGTVLHGFRGTLQLSVNFDNSTDNSTNDNSTHSTTTGLDAVAMRNMLNEVMAPVNRDLGTIQQSVGTIQQHTQTLIQNRDPLRAESRNVAEDVTGHLDFSDAHTFPHGSRDPHTVEPNAAPDDDSVEDVTPNPNSSGPGGEPPAPVTAETPKLSDKLCIPHHSSDVLQVDLQRIFDSQYRTLRDRFVAIPVPGKKENSQKVADQLKDQKEKTFQKITLEEYNELNGEKPVPPMEGTPALSDLALLNVSKIFMPRVCYEMLDRWEGELRDEETPIEDKNFLEKWIPRLRANQPNVLAANQSMLTGLRFRLQLRDKPDFIQKSLRCKQKVLKIEDFQGYSHTKLYASLNGIRRPQLFALLASDGLLSVVVQDDAAEYVVEEEQGLLEDFIFPLCGLVNFVVIDYDDQPVKVLWKDGKNQAATQLILNWVSSAMSAHAALTADESIDDDDSGDGELPDCLQPDPSHADQANPPCLDCSISGDTGFSLCLSPAQLKAIEPKHGILKIKRATISATQQHALASACSTVILDECMLEGSGGALCRVLLHGAPCLRMLKLEGRNPIKDEEFVELLAKINDADGQPELSLDSSTTEDLLQLPTTAALLRRTIVEECLNGSGISSLKWLTLTFDGATQIALPLFLREGIEEALGQGTNEMRRSIKHILSPKGSFPFGLPDEDTEQKLKHVLLAQLKNAMIVRQGNHARIVTRQTVAPPRAAEPSVAVPVQTNFWKDHLGGEKCDKCLSLIPADSDKCVACGETVPRGNGHKKVPNLGQAPPLAFAPSALSGNGVSVPNSPPAFPFAPTTTVPFSFVYQPCLTAPQNGKGVVGQLIQNGEDVQDAKEPRTVDSTVASQLVQNGEDVQGAKEPRAVDSTVSGQLVQNGEGVHGAKEPRSVDNNAVAGQLFQNGEDVQGAKEPHPVASTVAGQSFQNGEDVEGAKEPLIVDNGEDVQAEEEPPTDENAGSLGQGALVEGGEPAALVPLRRSRRNRGLDAEFFELLPESRRRRRGEQK